jgi:hypothetical protein
MRVWKGRLEWLLIGHKILRQIATDPSSLNLFYYANRRIGRRDTRETEVGLTKKGAVFSLIPLLAKAVRGRWLVKVLP